jgi:hypothetical protein
MLPSFSLSRYTYGVEIIVELMYEAIKTSIRKAAAKYSDVIAGISRKQIAMYLSRLRRNRSLIQYGFNQISPGSIEDTPGDTEWTRRLLLGNRPTLCPESNAEFHNTVGKSFMSTRNKIA